MPHVDRREDQPDDWAPTTSMAQAWDRGYVHAGETLVCRACGAAVPTSFKTSGTAGLATAEARHDDWHARVDRA